MRFFILAFLFCLLAPVSCAEAKNYYGSWQYTVYAKDNSAVNKDLLNPQPAKDIQKKTYFIGSKQLNLKDIFYTGYFRLEANPSKSYEVIGSYYPVKFSNPEEFIPIELSKKTSLKGGKTSLFWHTDFKNRSLGSAAIHWVSAAKYDPKADKIAGVTLVYDCSAAPCQELNTAFWKAKRISNIDLYSRTNYHFKAPIAAFLNLIDSEGRFSKWLLPQTNESELDTYKIYQSNVPDKYLKTSLLAVLKVSAEVTQSDQGIDSICKDSYCTDTGKYWEPYDKSKPDNIQNREANCQFSTRDRRRECCASGSPNGQCECSEQVAGITSSTKCCKGVSQCETRTTTNQPNGAVSVSKTNTITQLSGANLQSASQVLNPDYANLINQARSYGQSIVGGNFVPIANVINGNEELQAILPPQSISKVFPY